MKRCLYNCVQRVASGRRQRLYLPTPGGLGSWPSTCPPPSRLRRSWSPTSAGAEWRGAVSCPHSWTQSAQQHSKLTPKLEGIMQATLHRSLLFWHPMPAQTDWKDDNYLDAGHSNVRSRAQLGAGCPGVSLGILICRPKGAHHLLHQLRGEIQQGKGSGLLPASNDRFRCHH